MEDMYRNEKIAFVQWIKQADNTTLYDSILDLIGISPSQEDALWDFKRKAMISELTNRLTKLQFFRY